MSSYSAYMKSRKEKSINFRASIYEGLGFEQASNKYCEITRRVNDDETKILVNVDASQVFPTRYGFGMVVGRNHVVWLKDWQVIQVADWWLTEFTKGCYQVLLNKDYYKVAESTREFEDITVGDCASDSEFEKANGYHSWEDMVAIAKAQEEGLKESPVKFKA